MVYPREFAMDQEQIRRLARSLMGTHHPYGECLIDGPSEEDDVVAFLTAWFDREESGFTKFTTFGALDVFKIKFQSVGHCLQPDGEYVKMSHNGAIRVRQNDDKLYEFQQDDVVWAYP